MYRNHDECYTENLITGFCKNGEQCGGEEIRPRIIVCDCIHCKYYSVRKELKRYANTIR